MNSRWFYDILLTAFVLLLLMVVPTEAKQCADKSADAAAYVACAGRFAEQQNRNAPAMCASDATRGPLAYRRCLERNGVNTDDLAMPYGARSDEEDEGESGNAQGGKGPPASGGGSDAGDKGESYAMVNKADMMIILTSLLTSFLLVELSQYV